MAPRPTCRSIGAPRIPSGPQHERQPMHRSRPAPRFSICSLRTFAPGGAIPSLLLALVPCPAAQAVANGFPALRGDEDGAPPVMHLQLDPREALTVIGASGRVTPGAAPDGGRELLGSLGVSFHQAGAAPEGDSCGGVAFTP